MGGFGKRYAVAAALDGNEAWTRQAELPYSETKLCGEFGERMLDERRGVSRDVVERETDGHGKELDIQMNRGALRVRVFGMTVSR